MRGRDAEAMARAHVLPELGPGFRARGSLVVAEPIEWLLRGFLFEGSGHTGKDFYVWVFVQPLSVPFEAIALTYGHRLGGGSHFWNMDELSDPGTRAPLIDAIRRDGRPFLESVPGPHEFAHHAASLAEEAGQNALLFEGAGHAFVIANEIDHGRRCLGRVLELVQPSAEGWLAEVRARAERILHLLSGAGDPIPQLDEWRRYTASQLRLATLLEK